MAPSGPGSVSSGAPSSEGGSQTSHESLGVLGRDGEGADADLLRGNSSSTKVGGTCRRCVAVVHALTISSTCKQPVLGKASTCKF